MYKVKLSGWKPTKSYNKDNMDLLIKTVLEGSGYETENDKKIASEMFNRVIEGKTEFIEEKTLNEAQNSTLFYRAYGFIADVTSE